MRPDESTTQALRRLGYQRVDHERGGELCRRLRERSRQGGSAGVSCHGRHVERIADGEPVWELGCSASVETANAWIERMEETHAWECDLCDETHRSAEDCCACGGDGFQEDDGSACACGCPKGQQMADAAASEFAWMIPHVRRSEAARRRGDTEEAERIKRDALRWDSPFDPNSELWGGVP